MNKQQLIQAIAKDAGITQTAATAALNSFQRRTADALESGKTVKIVGFGTFKTSDNPARQGRNPKTGEAVHVPAKTRISFVAGKGLKAAVN